MATPNGETKMYAIEQIGTRIGKAMARDNIADNLPVKWTGLTPVDHDCIPPGMDRKAIEAIAKDVYFGELELAGFVTGEPVQSFLFATDSQHGEIHSTSWYAAKQQLMQMAPQSAIDDGAWGWVEVKDWVRFEVGVKADAIADEIDNAIRQSKERIGGVK